MALTPFSDCYFLKNQIDPISAATTLEAPGLDGAQVAIHKSLPFCFQRGL